VKVKERNEAKQTKFIEVEEKINLKYTRQTNRMRITKEKSILKTNRI
jgi:hypothetical protein